MRTKQDFEEVQQQVSIEVVANLLLQKQWRMYIYPGEKTGSIRIYPATQSFYDFGRSTGGDLIRLWSHIKDCDSWTALCQIRETFGLNMPNRKQSRAMIAQQEQARKAAEEAKKQAKRRWRMEVDTLKSECQLYRAILDSEHCRPLSWTWCACQNRLTAAKGLLDLMCGIY